MKKQTHSFQIGLGKRIVLEHDPDNENEAEFLKECHEVAKERPSTLQEFFTALANLQNKKARGLINNGPRMSRGVQKP